MAGEVASVALAAGAARAVRAEGMGSTMLLLKPAEQGLDAVVGVAALRAAAEVANATSEPTVMIGGGVAAGLGGPTVIVSWDGKTTAAIQSWLAALAVALSEAGHVGTIQPVPKRHFDPDKMLDRPARVIPTMFAAYQLISYPVGPNSRRFWLTPDDRFRRSAAWLAGWGAELTDTPRYVQAVLTYTQLTELDLTEWITSAAAIVNGAVAVRYHHPGQRRARKLQLSQRGQLLVQETDPMRSWRELVAQAREQLLIDPAALDVGQVRNTRGDSAWDWDDLQYDLATPGHQPPLRTPSFARHLWHERVVDVAAIQLLTGAHLSHATNLDRWHVEEVAADRYLVQAPDLTPWFAQDAPDPQVLEQARHDFGDMILTNAHERATPGPYSRTWEWK